MNMKNTFSSSFFSIVTISICVFLWYLTMCQNKYSRPELTCYESENISNFDVLKFPSDVFIKEQEAGEVDSCEQLMKNAGALKCFDDDYKNRSTICPIEKSLWQPNGCKIHKYSNREIAECLKTVPSMTKKKEILMLGDSRVRHLFKSLKYKLQDKPVPAGRSKINKGTYTDSKTGLTLHFITNLHINNETLEQLKETIRSKSRPVLLLIGIALHTLSVTNRTVEGLHGYRRNFLKMVPLLENLTSTTTVVWMLQSPTDHAFDGIENLGIQLYNDAAIELLRGSHVHLMYSARSIGFATIKSYMDLVHLGVAGDRMIVEVLLNYLCNKHVSSIQDVNVCCRKSKPES